MVLPALIQTGKKTAVDFSQIQSIVGSHNVSLGFKEHKDLPSHPSIADICGQNAACCILMEVQHSRNVIRHWVLVIKHPVTYFDSLSLSLPHMYAITGAEPKLMRAFKGLKVDMPTSRVQKNLAHVRDCGLHVACRAVFHTYSNSQYYSFLKSLGADTDDSVVMMCLLHLLDLKAVKIKHK